jgi:subtilisin family serine protease
LAQTTEKPTPTPQADSKKPKLSPELQILAEQYQTSRGGETTLNGYDSEQLVRHFGIRDKNENPLVKVAIYLQPKTEVKKIKEFGAKIYLVNDDVIYAAVPVKALGRLAEISEVREIGVMKPLQIPTPTEDDGVPPGRGRGDAPQTPVANVFDKKGLTGQGVIIGMIDTGIDWRHPDFIRPDGTSRILAIWDLLDNSFQQSGGKIGTAPPLLTNGGETLGGTLYTNQQINAALQNKGTVNSTDRNGHGTAVAGVAAGNGRATANGVPSGTYAGIAPEADLLIVRAMDCDGLEPLAALTAHWMAGEAKKLKRPLVINFSAGDQANAHNGDSMAEREIDKLLLNPQTKQPQSGISLIVSAGNDGRSSFHGVGRFGAVGQNNQTSQKIELNIKKPTHLLGVFTNDEQWSVIFKSTNPIFAGKDDKPAWIYLDKEQNQIKVQPAAAELKQPAEFQKFANEVKFYRGKNELAYFALPPGEYELYVKGAGTKVVDGRFDFYLQDPSHGSFGTGTDKRGMVSSPGNSATAITVGSFDFQDSFENLQGETIRYNLPTGDVSDYSNPGFRLDGLVKPDFVAPGRFVITALSAGSQTANGGCTDNISLVKNNKPTMITKDGFHLATSGTSFAAPLVTGLAALLLQKNPTLTNEQIRQTLRKSVSSEDEHTGKLPNERWGYGKINPSAVVQCAVNLKQCGF